MKRIIVVNVKVCAKTLTSILFVIGKCIKLYYSLKCLGTKDQNVYNLPSVFRKKKEFSVHKDRHTHTQAANDKANVNKGK